MEPYMGYHPDVAMEPALEIWVDVDTTPVHIRLAGGLDRETGRISSPWSIRFFKRGTWTLRCRSTSSHSARQDSRPWRTSSIWSQLLGGAWNGQPGLSEVSARVYRCPKTQRPIRVVGRQ